MTNAALSPAGKKAIFSSQVYVDRVFSCFNVSLNSILFRRARSKAHLKINNDRK